MTENMFNRELRGEIEILYLNPRFITGPVKSLIKRYEIEDGRQLNIEEWLGSGSRSIMLSSVEDIQVLPPSSIPKRLINYGTLVFRTGGTSENDRFQWEGVKNPKEVKDFIWSLKVKKEKQNEDSKLDEDLLNKKRLLDRNEHKYNRSQRLQNTKRSVAVEDWKILPEKTFDAAITPSYIEKQLIEGYLKDESNGNRWSYVCVERVPYPKEFVWRVLLLTENIRLWLHGIESDRENALPQKFGLGAHIGDGGEAGQKFIINCTPYSSVSFNAGNYFKVELSNHEPGWTEIRIEVYGFSKNTFLEKLFPMKKEVDVFSQTMDSMVKKAARRLVNLCEDYYLFGRPISSFEDNQYEWVTWEVGAEDGVFKFYPNVNEQPSVNVGDRVEAGQKIGYVKLDNTAHDVQYCMRNFYLYSSNGGVIEQVIKENGEAIRGGDRVALLRIGEVKITRAVHEVQQNIIEMVPEDIENATEIRTNSDLISLETTELSEALRFFQVSESYHSIEELRVAYEKQYESRHSDFHEELNQHYSVLKAIIRTDG